MFRITSNKHLRSANHVDCSLWVCHTHQAQARYEHYIDGLVEGCGISSASAMEIPQSCTKPSICSLQQMILIRLWCTDAKSHTWFFTKQLIHPLGKSFDKLRPKQNGRRFANNIFKYRWIAFSVCYQKQLLQLTMSQHWFNNWLSIVSCHDVNVVSFNEMEWFNIFGEEPIIVNANPISTIFHLAGSQNMKNKTILIKSQNYWCKTEKIVTFAMIYYICQWPHPQYPWRPFVSCACCISITSASIHVM